MSKITSSAASVAGASPRLSHDQLMSLINSMTDSVIAVDKNHKVNVYNGAAMNILDRNETIQGKPIAPLFDLIDKDNQPVDVDKLIDNTETPTTNRDLRFKYTDNSLINLYIDIAPVYSGYHSKSDDSNAGYVMIFRDITREKSLEEERDEFISVVSHELRTPIAIAEGNISNAQFIADRTGDIEQIKTALKQAHDQTLFLADMINDLATLSRAERGALKVEVESIDVKDLVASLVNNYNGHATEKGLHLKSETALGLDKLQSGNLYVREILQNFITNAIKYTEKGSVTISAKPAEKGVMFSVSDTGIGLSRSDKERVFDKFFRAEDYRTRQHNGTGLGLYVTMKLARLLHAEITVDSELDRGTTFSVYVPNLS